MAGHFLSDDIIKRSTAQIGCDFMLLCRLAMPLLVVKKISAPNAFKNAPFGNPPKNRASSIRTPQALKVLTTLSWAGAALAVTNAVLIGEDCGSKWA